MKCVPCRRYSSNSPMSEPVSLPADRVKDANAFDITGIDLAGPLFTRDGDGLLHVVLDQKLYIQITELIFVGTNSELKNLDWDKIMKKRPILNLLNGSSTPTAAWWGGWWERLVRVIKELLKRTLGKAILTYEELLTVLCDCEAVVNSRPLTYVSEDPNDLIPLTPSLFLNGKSSYDTVDLDLSEFSKFQKRINIVEN
ncbi:integrase catalytic domain-containing protein [Trichonephila clavipes]|nr:integrase catalytic domain-containing protein [Trichonephila clavipes]